MRRLASVVRVRHLLLEVVGIRVCGRHRGRVQPAHRGLEGIPHHAHTSLVLDAFSMAAWTQTRRGVDIDGVVCHSDAGSLSAPQGS
jgi:hypothetical protein